VRYTVTTYAGREFTHPGQRWELIDLRDDQEYHPQISQIDADKAI
jgi:hypothetical protein